MTKRDLLLQILVLSSFYLGWLEGKSSQTDEVKKQSIEGLSKIIIASKARIDPAVIKVTLF